MSQAAHKRAKAPRSKRRWLVLAATVALVAVAAGVWFALSRDDPPTPSEEFNAELRSQGLTFDKFHSDPYGLTVSFARHGQPLTDYYLFVACWSPDAADVETAAWQPFVDAVAVIDRGAEVEFTPQTDEDPVDGRTYHTTTVTVTPAKSPLPIEDAVNHARQVVTALVQTTPCR